jgi:ketosteroid isomerase-like protein
MRNVMMLGWTAALILSLCCWGDLSPAADPQTEKEIRELLAREAQAYATKNVDAAMALVAQHSGSVFLDNQPDGVYIGPEQIRQMYERDFSHIKGADLKFTWLRISSQGNIAWFASESEVTVDLGKKKPTFPARWTGVLEKRNGQWLIVQSHISYPKIPKKKKPKREGPKRRQQQ